MAPPRRGHVRVIFYAPPDFKAEILKESKQRKMTLGQLIQEALYSRMRLIRK